MICLYAETPISILALILYTCMCIPYLHIAQVSSRLLAFILHPHQHTESTSTVRCELDLPVYRMHDFGGGGEETCSICLMDFEAEDLVNRLPNCAHLFHVECIEKWMDRCKFACPICRVCIFIQDRNLDSFVSNEASLKASSSAQASSTSMVPPVLPLSVQAAPRSTPSRKQDSSAIITKWQSRI